MTFLLSLIGAAIGAGIGASVTRHELEGALIGGLIGGVAGLLLGLARQARLYARVSGLEEQVKILRERLRRLESTAPVPEPQPVRATTRTAPDLGATFATPPSVVVDATAEPVPKPAPARPPAPASATPSPSVPAAAGFDLELPDSVLAQAARAADDTPPSTSPENAWESSSEQRPPPAGKSPSSPNALVAFLFGGNTIARIGVAILFTGVAFLAKYAADSGLFPIEFRLAAIGGVAILLTALGWRLRDKRRDYALLLQGGGIAVLYLTVFAALRLYQLLPVTLAGALLVAVAVAAAVLAIGQDARVLAFVGAAGGFAAPVLASTGGGNHVALFGFYLVLNLGILAVSWFKAWRELNLAGFVFTFGIGAAWGARSYQNSDFATVEPFLIVFFVLFVAIAVLFALRQPPRLRGYVDGSLVFGVPLATFALQYKLVEPFEFGAAYSVLAMAALYIALGAWVLRRRDEQLRLLGEAFVAIGVGFATLAVPLGLDARATAATWALEGAAAVWVGVRQQRALTRVAGLLLQLAAGVSLFIAYADAFDLPAGINGRALGMALISVSALLSLWHLERAREGLRAFEQPALPMLAVYGLVTWFGIGLLEAPALFARGDRAGGLLLFTTISAGAMAWLSPRLQLAALAVPASLLVPAGMALALATLLENSYPLAGPGVLAWPLLFAVVYWRLGSNTPEEESRAERLQHAGALWLLAGLLGWQAGHQAHVLVGAAGAWRLAAAGLAPAALMVVTLGIVDRCAWLPGARPRLYLGGALGPIAALLGLWVLVACVAHDGNPWPLSYLPLLNPLDISIGLVLVALVAWLRRYDAEVQVDEGDRTLPGIGWRILALLGFVWLNAILARAAHFWGGVRYELDNLLASAGYQASLAVLWGGLGIACMVAGTRRARRPLWITGAGLMALVVVKLLVFDLANTGTVARIVSFIAIGGLMLAVGYLAPVPPRAEEAAQAADDGPVPAARSEQP